ncbi:hypothetical protein BDW68DRAFT_160709 [Aspergillus falconensis]
MWHSEDRGQYNHPGRQELNSSIVSHVSSWKDNGQRSGRYLERLQDDALSLQQALSASHLKMSREMKSKEKQSVVCVRCVHQNAVDATGFTHIIRL